MDIPQVLAVLAPGVHWGPCAQTGASYAEFEQGWLSVYGPDDPPPTEAEMLSCWDDLETGRTAAIEREHRSASVAVLLGQRAPDMQSLAKLVRILAEDVYARLNDLRQHDVRASGPLARDTESEIMARLVAGLGSGPLTA